MVLKRVVILHLEQSLQVTSESVLFKVINNITKSIYTRTIGQTKLLNIFTVKEWVYNLC